MNKNLLFTFISIISFIFILASSAEAKRFGGGSSFGGKKSYSSPFKQKSSQQKSFSQQKAAASNQQRKQQLSSRGGLMGMLGGLALGGLLGSLFFGGAFENFNFFDFLIIGGIIWAVFWFMKRKSPIPSQASAAGAYNVETPSQTENSQTNTNITQSQFKLNSDNTDASFENKEAGKETSFADGFGMDYGHNKKTGQTNQSNDVILPDWFNQEEFLNGARSAYSLLQEAWDSGNLDAIKGLTTDEVYNEISRQYAAEASQTKTRIMQLNAELIDFNSVDDHSEASVLFDALLDESDSNTSGRAKQVRELWHFIRENNSTEPTWYLDGLQQLE